MPTYDDNTTLLHHQPDAAAQATPATGVRPSGDRPVEMPPVEEPPSKPGKSPVEEPGDPYPKPPAPEIPPVEKPWDLPPEPPVKEPPSDDPDQIRPSMADVTPSWAVQESKYSLYPIATPGQDAVALAEREFNRLGSHDDSR